MQHASQSELLEDSAIDRPRKPAMKEEAKKSMANTIFGKPCIKKIKDVGYATNENNPHATTPQHRCTR